MALSDRTNLLVQKYIRRQYLELEECSLKKDRLSPVRVKGRKP